MLTILELFGVERLTAGVDEAINLGVVVVDGGDGSGGGVGLLGLHEALFDIIDKCVLVLIDDTVVMVFVAIRPAGGVLHLRADVKRVELERLGLCAQPKRISASNSCLKKDIF